MTKSSKSNFLRRRQRVNKHYREACAAGVLPLSISPSGERVVLLGFGACSQGGVFRHFWSDFGGKLDPEETAKAAALREFHEETAYFFSNKVTSESHLLKLSGNDKYVSFVAEVPYVDEQEVRQQSLKVRVEGTLYERNHVEMENYKWMPLEFLLSQADVLHEAGLYPPFIEYHLSQKSVQTILRVLLTKKVQDLKVSTFESLLFKESLFS
jgi:8-oxo-dGTP pyrophosphatase MutT (NUDIX family)